MKNSLTIIGIIVLGAGMSLAQSEQPLLGDLAKKNKGVHKDVKTFTEADLPSSSAATVDNKVVAPATQSAGSESTSASAASAEKKDGTKDAHETGSGSAKVAELKKQIDSYQQERDTWKKSVKRYEDLLANETVDFRRKTYEDAIENDKKNVVFYQQKLDQAQSDLTTAQKTASSSSSGTPAAASRP